MKTIEEKQHILIVDDEYTNIKTIKRVLKNSDIVFYEAGSGPEALEILKKTEVDILLLDLNMPKMSGYEVLENLKLSDIFTKTSIIILSALMEKEDKINALQLGAIDYLTKPFISAELIAKVNIHLSLRSFQRKLNKKTTNLEEQLMVQTREIKRAQEATVFSLAMLAESRDPETGTHLERMSQYSTIIARQLKDQIFNNVKVDDEFIYILEKVSVLHDIGKVGIPDNILLKPGKLTNEEFDEMKNHTVYGGKTLDQALNKLEKPARYLVIARNVAYYHHEKWNGSGYPENLKGENIPICARIVALADVYDALRSKRVYKPSFSHEKARAIIIEGKGSHFQPLIVDIFLKCEQEFISIAQKFGYE